jgi:hypothetical protein
LKDSSLLEPKGVETEKVLNGLIRALRDNLFPSAFSLNTWVERHNQCEA